MQILNLDPNTLIRPFTFGSAASSNNKVLQILSESLLSIKDSKLTIHSTNMEVETYCSVDLNGNDYVSGATTIPSRKANAILKHLKDNSVINLEKKADSFYITADNVSFKLNTMNPDDFPKLAFDNPLASITIDCITLEALVKHSRSSILTQPNTSKPLYSSLLMEVSKDNLTFVATDGNRMSVAKTSAKMFDATNLPDNGVTALIPNTALNFIVSALNENPNDKVTVDILPQGVRFSINDYGIVTKTTSGKYPEYGLLIRPIDTPSMMCNRNELLQTLQLCTSVSSEKATYIKLQLEQGVLTVTLKNDIQEEASSQLQVSYAGPSIDATYNINLLRECISSFPEKGDLVLNIGKSLQPLLVRLGNDESFTTILMPVRT